MATAYPIMLPIGQKELDHSAVLTGQFCATTPLLQLMLVNTGTTSDMNLATCQRFAPTQTSPDFSQDTALANRFAQLLAVLAEYVRAERDLEDIGYSLDPAYANWNTDAERAQDRLIDVLDALRQMPVNIPEDVPLRQIAMSVQAMQRSDLNEARLFHEQIDRCIAQRFMQPAISATARHRNLLVQWSRPIIAAFAALPLFDDKCAQGFEASDENASSL